MDTGPNAVDEGGAINPKTGVGMAGPIKNNLPPSVPQSTNKNLSNYDPKAPSLSPKLGGPKLYTSFASTPENFPTYQNPINGQMPASTISTAPGVLPTYLIGTPAQPLATAITSTIPTATSSSSSSSSGFMSPTDQTSVFNSMNSSSSSGTDSMGSGGSALASFNDASSGGTDPVTAQIEQNLQALMSQASTPPPSLLTEYNNLIQSSGIQADQVSAMNLQTIMSGTVSDIRQEVQAHGGFATESQVQSLASQRNQFLQQQLTTLQQGISLKQSWISSTMQYTSQDYTNAEANFEKNYQLQSTLLSTLGRLQTSGATAEARFQTQQMNQLKFLVDSGGLQNADPSLIASYAATTGIPASMITSAATNEDSKLSLSQALQASLLNERNAGGATSYQDQMRASSVTTFLNGVKGTDGLVTAQSYQQALQQFSASGGTAANFLNQFPPTQYLNRDQIDALPSDVPELQDIKFQADLQDGITAVSSGGLDSANAENILLGEYPNDATKIKDAFGALQ